MNITFIQLVIAVFVLVCTSAGATFTMMDFATKSTIQGLEIKIEDQKEEIQKLDKRLTLCFRSNSRETVDIDSSRSANNDTFQMIKILSPLSGELVDQEDFVEAKSLGVIPEKYKVYLYVRDPIGQWWSWGEVKENNIKVQFGVNSDRGESFEIRLLLSDKVIPKGGPHVILPRSIASDSVIVIRR